MPSVIEMFRVAVPVPLVLVAVMVTAVEPRLVGVPLITPVVVFRLKPAGNPVAPKLVGVLVAVIVYENDTSITPLAPVALVMTGSADPMVRLSDAVPLPALFVAVSVTVEVPAVVGVPLMTPVAVFTLKPAGSPLAPKLVGVLVAVIV